MDFPIIDLLDEAACYAQLVTWIHPEGLACPDCHRSDHLRIHRRGREPVIDYRCGQCGRVFNAFTGTALQGIHYRPRTIILILRGFAQGVPTAQLARELNCDRCHLLALRHRLQELAFRLRERMPLDDPVVEADEMYQNAGEKGVPHRDPDDPPRRRQPGAGPRQLGQRPAADLRCGGSGQWADPPPGRTLRRRADVTAGRAARDLAQDQGEHRRVGVLRGPARPRSGSCHRLSRGWRVGAGR